MLFHTDDCNKIWFYFAEYSQTNLIRLVHAQKECVDVSVLPTEPRDGRKYMGKTKFDRNGKR